MLNFNKMNVTALSFEQKGLNTPKRKKNAREVTLQEQRNVARVLAHQLEWLVSVVLPADAGVLQNLLDALLDACRLLQPTTTEKNASQPTP